MIIGTIKHAPNRPRFTLPKINFARYNKAGREIVIANTGLKPENIPIDSSINDVKKKLKNVRKTVLNIDSKKVKG